MLVLYLDKLKLEKTNSSLLVSDYRLAAFDCIAVFVNN